MLTIARNRLPQRAAAPKRARQRIRYQEAGDKLIAHVEKRSLLGWRPTGVREVVDLKRAAKAMQIWEAQNGVTGGDDTAGFGSRLKKFGRKILKNKVVKGVVKAHTAPLKLAHRITHGKNSPIRKAELALQKTVGKALPFTKPFIKVHNKLAGATAKAVVKATGGGKGKPDLPTAQELAELREATRRVKAVGIAKALKKVPPAARAEVKKELIRKATSWVVKSPDTGITYSFKL